MQDEELTGEIIAAAIEVHRALGAGLLESAYHECLAHELSIRGVRYECEIPVAVEYKGLRICDAYRADFLVENRVIVELKAVERVMDVHKAQLLTYLKLTGRRCGLLLNFNTSLMKKGIYRIVN